MRSFLRLKLLFLFMLAALPAFGQQDTVRVALMHGIPQKWALDDNFSVFLKMLDKASAEKAELFITPECWLDGYAAPDKTSTPERLRQIAQEPGKSEYLARAAEEAKRRSMYICLGFTSIEDNKIYNSAGLWDADGNLVGIYHKTHLQEHDLQYSPGMAIPAWPSKWGPLGIMICADRRWPETARVLRLQGTRLILNPTYGFSGEMNEAIMRTRAYENQCFIAFTHPGESLITGPTGDVVAKTKSDQPGILVETLPLAQAKNDNHIRDRRPDLYDIITKE